MSFDESARAELVALVRSQGYEHREQAFQLTSGGWSHDYVDGKYALSSGEALRLAAESAVELVGPDWDVVGGPTMGADALAHAMALVTGKGWFSVRKEPKGHGREAWLEGTRLSPGQRVIAVEDVCSTGGSLLKAIAKLRDLGAEVVAATALLDRSPTVGRACQAAGVAWMPLLSWRDLGIEPL